MHNLPTPITELSMEKSFNYTKLCNQLDACEDKEMLRRFAKQALKLSMINEMNVANLIKSYATSDVQPIFLPKEGE